MEGLSVAVGRTYGGALTKAGAAPLTMSSKEIAEVVEKQHGNVKISIERLAEKGLVTFFAVQEKSTGGRPSEVYHVNQRDSYVVVAQLSPEFTARLVDRWQELEKPVAQPKGLEPLKRIGPDMLHGVGGDVPNLHDVKGRAARSGLCHFCRLCLSGVDRAADAVKAGERYSLHFPCGKYVRAWRRCLRHYHRARPRLLRVARTSARTSAPQS